MSHKNPLGCKYEYLKFLKRHLSSNEVFSVITFLVEAVLRAGWLLRSLKKLNPKLLLVY